MRRRILLKKEEENFDADYDEAALRSDRAFKKKFGAFTKRGKKGGHYSYTDKTLRQKVVLNPEAVQKALQRSPEYNRLQRLIKTPIAVRTKKLRDRIREQELPHVRAQMKALQAKIEPVVEQLCRMDTQMKRLISRANYILFKSGNTKAENNQQLRRKLANVVKKVTEGMRRQQYEKNRKELRRLHGYWDFLDKKYRQPGDAKPGNPQQGTQNDNHQE